MSGDDEESKEARQVMPALGPGAPTKFEYDKAHAGSQAIPRMVPLVWPVLCSKCSPTGVFGAHAVKS